MRLSIRSPRCRPLEERHKYSRLRPATSAETDLPNRALEAPSDAAKWASAEEQKEPTHGSRQLRVMVGLPYRGLHTQSAEPGLRSGGFHGKEQRCLQEVKWILKAPTKKASGGGSAMGTSTAGVGCHEEEGLLRTLYPRRHLAHLRPAALAGERPISRCATSFQGEQRCQSGRRRLTSTPRF